MRSLQLGVVVAVLVTLSGCSAASSTAISRQASPGTSVPAAAASSQTPGPPATVEISASSVTVLDQNRHEIQRETYTSSADAMIAMLDVVFGTHEVSTCGVDWGSADQHVYVDRLSAQDSDAKVRILVKTASLNGISIRSSTGFGVGDDVSHVIAGLQPAQIDTNLSQAVWEAGATPAGGAVVAYDEGTVAYELFAPGQPGVADCD